ncbi:receptor-like cytoplasmic kinase 176 isoform X2 [Cornus florida]|nr:receptor-like cytoplasmic kinase 176 isoform X2 [Cornus florida]
MAQGSLEDHLFTRACIQPLSWNLRVKVALGAAKGLAFLHSSEAKLKSSDFKSSNILLDSNFDAKLDDFGLARPLVGVVDVLPGPYGYDPDYVVIRGTGTSNGYTAPEYAVTGDPTAKSEVYSFGVVLLEMLTGRRAVDKNSLIGKDKQYPASKILRLMDPRIKGQYSVGGARRAANIAIKCLQTEPKLRPNMNEVVEALEQLQDLKDTESPKRESLHNNHNNSKR